MKPRYDLSLKQAKQIQRRFCLITAATAIVVLIGVLMMMYLEGLGAIDALYFSVVSLTTVSYGDFTPEATGGKLFVMLYLITGVAIVAALLNNILKSAGARRVTNHLEEVEK